MSNIKIKVVGIGGAGGNTISRLSKYKTEGVDLIIINTDSQDLKKVKADFKIQIGNKITKGLGTGMNPGNGLRAAKESSEEIKNLLIDADMVFITGGFGGGCLRGSSFILTNPEGPVRDDSIKPGSMVYTFENGSLIKRKVLAAMKTGIKKVLELKTRNRTIYASEDHPFLRVKPLNHLSNDRFSKFTLEWIELRNLEIGDLIVILRKLPDERNSLKLPDDSLTNTKFCQLFGFLLGDGWISRSKDSWKVYFAISDNEENNQKYLNIIKETVGLQMKKNKEGIWYQGNSKKIYELLEKLGLHKPAKEKEIPNWVFALPELQKKAFIIGLADADGCYSVQAGGTGLSKKEIKFEMSSEKLIKGLKVLCDGIGLRTSNVSSRKRILKPPHSKKEKEFTSWTLRIYKTHELLGVLPHPKVRAGLSFLYKFRSKKTPEFFKYFGFNRIKSIKKIGNEEVYDITVEKSHNFIADGFVVHNTCSGAAPIVADIAKSQGALTIAVITKPFSFEGVQRTRIAKSALKNLKDKVDALISIPNNRLVKLANEKTTLDYSFSTGDKILREAILGICDLILKPGIINVDFAAVKTILKNSGRALITQSQAKGKNRAIRAAKEALSSPMIDFSPKGARGVLFNIAGKDLSLSEIKEAANTICQNVNKSAKIIFGAREDKELKKGVIKIMLIATGF